MNRERMDQWCGGGILVLSLGALVYGPLVTGAFRPQDFLVLQGLAVIIGILWGGRLVLSPHRRLLFPPVAWVVVSFAGYACLRYLSADIEYVARKECLKVLVYALLFLVFLNELHVQRKTDLIVVVLIGLGTAISLYALYQFLTDSNRVWHFIRPALYAGRGSGTYICPNHLAGFLGVMAPLGLAYAFMSSFSPVRKILLGYASLCLLIGIYVSRSRGGVVAAGLALVVLFTQLIKQRQYQIRALILCAVLVLAFVAVELKGGFLQARLKNLSSSSPTSELAMRWMMWKSAFEMWQDHFWMGAGPAHFDYRFRVYRQPHFRARPDRAHNDYVNTLADWGVVGTALVALAWALYYRGVFKHWPALQPDPEDWENAQGNHRAFVVGSATGLLAILAHSFVDYNMHVPANALLAVALLALGTGHLHRDEPRYWFRLPRIGQGCVLPALLAMLTFLGYHLWRGAREAFWLDRAAHERIDVGKKIVALENACRVEPKNPETAYTLGEIHRSLSWHGGDDYRAQADAAMRWLERCWTLNPYDGSAYLRYGMCQDWLGRHAEAAPYYRRAHELDPKGHYTTAHVGWHYFQAGNYAEAQRWFYRSKLMNWHENPLADSYLKFVEERLAGQREEKQ